MSGDPPWPSFCLSVQDNPSRLKVIYNHFRSAVAYDTLTVDVLTPVQAARSSKEQLSTFEFEPEKSDIWKDLHDFYFACTVYGCMLDNIASEQVSILRFFHLTHTDFVSISVPGRSSLSSRFL